MQNSAGQKARNRKKQFDPANAGPEYFFNRDLSWLEFNYRVLQEAGNPGVPLLERLKFLGIFTSNLDEFFMKRAGWLKRQAEVGVMRKSIDGLTAEQQLAAVRKKVTGMLKEQADCYLHDIKPKLAEKGIILSQWEELSGDERAIANDYFQRRVFPVLTPLAVDPGHPFPFISNLSISLGVAINQDETEDVMFARVKVPKTLPQWIRIETGETNRFLFVSLLDMIRDNLCLLFPDVKILSVMPFRVTRNADVERDEEDAADLLELMEQELKQRRFEPVVRMEVCPGADQWLLNFLMRELDITPNEVYESQGEMDYSDLQAVVALKIPALRFDPWLPQVPPAFTDSRADVFSVIRAGDVLLHHPYDDFASSVERFVRTAAEDRKTLAIKTIVYRTGDDSPMIRTLIRAAENQKQVVCLVELKARFDEERNIYWAQMMEKAGIHVVYGLVGLKTHGKVCLVIREEGDALRCYAHIGTGNYNRQTAGVYTDLGFMTCRPDITRELVDLFNFISGHSIKRKYEKLLVAPVNMRERFIAMIEREIAHQQAGRPAHIVAKMNSLEDDSVIKSLYRASQAGVKIELIIRGFCCLKPGLEGISENISVKSIVGRFLEHSRIFYFRNGAERPADGEFFIGSADWMYRNLLARVEVITPIEDCGLRERCLELLNILLADRIHTWDLNQDGVYTRRVKPGLDSDVKSGAHEKFMALAKQRSSPGA